jgi:hypothetical protein
MQTRDWILLERNYNELESRREQEAKESAERMKAFEKERDKKSVEELTAEALERSAKEGAEAEAERERSKAQTPEEASSARYKAFLLLVELRKIATAMGLDMCAAQMEGWDDDGGRFLEATKWIRLVLDVLSDGPFRVTRDEVPVSDLHTFDDRDTYYCMDVLPDRLGE